jgi:hypothetical protein
MKPNPLIISGPAEDTGIIYKAVDSVWPDIALKYCARAIRSMKKKRKTSFTGMAV